MIDVFDDAYLSGPHAVLGDLRRDHPVFFHEDLDMWVVSRHEDIRLAFLDHETFCPDNALNVLSTPSLATLRILTEMGFRLPRTLANNGTTTHLQLRRLVTRFIGPSQVQKATSVITQAAQSGVSDALDELEATGFCDLVQTIARRVPCDVILSLLGVHDLDVVMFTRWSAAALELFWGRPTPVRQQVLARDVGAFHQWLGVALDVTSADDDSMLGALVRCRIDGRTLDRQEIIGACFFTLIAGQETTSQLLATGFHQLFREPARRLSLRDNSIVVGWVDELLRRDPPISTWRRVTSRAISLGGVDIPQGANVLLMLMAAGSDPEVFSNAAELCPHRHNAREHLAFGLGRHRCPGAELARAEATISLRIANERLPALRLVEQRPPMLALLSFRSPTRVLVERV